MTYNDFVAQAIQEKEQDLNLLNYYFFEEGFSSEECENIKEYCSSFSSEEAGTFSGDGGDYRISNISWIPYQPDSPIQFFFERMGEFCNIANRMWQFDLIGMSENIQYTHYCGSNRGRYKKHYDIGPGFWHRKISIVVQLDDPNDYIGGDLLLHKGGEPEFAPKKKGDVILFPSFLVHEVTPVISGNRRSMVCWVTGPPLR